VPSLLVPDVHRFDIGVINDIEAALLMSPIPEGPLFHSSTPDLDGAINPPPDCSSDAVISWLTEPPLGLVHPPSPLEFTSENILRYLESFNTGTGNIAGDANLDINDINVNTVSSSSPATVLSDSVFRLALENSSCDDESVMGVDESAEPTLGSSPPEHGSVPALGTEHPEPVAMPVAKKRHRMNPALVTKVSKTRRKDKVYTFIEDSKARSKRYSKISIKIEKLVERLHIQTRCYGAVMFASIDSIALSHTKSHFTPNLRFSQEACGIVEGCSKTLGNLMSQHWHRSQVDHSLRLDHWRSEAAESTADQ